jgi:nicotinamidase/pyrazinamidase
LHAGTLAAPGKGTLVGDAAARRESAVNREQVGPAPDRGDALLVVDVQNDFLPGGALGIVAGDAILGPLNRLLDAWRDRGLPVVLSRDWHPAGHCSFRPQGGPWPDHCVAGTPGAEFDSRLHRSPGDLVISKATEPDRDAYSALDGTPLADELRRRGIRRLFVAGIATDYCVRATGGDARRAGLDVVVLRDAVAAVDARPGDGERALGELAGAGCGIATTGEVIAALEHPR